jgi:hypothetical protein
MSRTLGPILATGALTLANQSVFNNKPVDWRIPIATGFLGVAFSLLERAAPDLAVTLAWTTLLTTLLTRLDPKVPSPVETAYAWWNTTKGK